MEVGMGDGAGGNIGGTSPNRCKGNVCSSFLLRCSESASPSCCSSSPGTLASPSAHGLDSSCLNPQHLPTDTRAEGSHNLSFGKESSQQTGVGFCLFWPLCPNPILSELQFSIKFCQYITASFPTSLSTPPCALSPSSTSQVHLCCSRIESVPHLSRCTVTVMRKWQCSALDFS